MKKKLVSLLLVAAMVVTAVACGSDSDDGSSSSSGEGGSESSSSGDGDSLTVWCWDPDFNIASMEAAAEIYKQDNPNFEIEIVETSWDDTQAKLTTAGTSGNYDSLPDIVLIQDNAFQKNVINYPDMFVDLSDSDINFDDFASAKAAYSIVDGANYGVPFDSGTCVTVLRSDVLAEAGYTIEDFEDITWPEFIEKGKVVLEKTGKAMLSAQASSPDLLTLMMQSAGGNFFDEDGNVTISGNDALRESMEYYVEMVEEGILIEVNEWDEYVATITNGTVAGAINGCWILATVQTLEDESGNWEIANIPGLEAHPDATNYSNQGGSSWAIVASGNTELATDFMSATYAGSTELYDTILGPTGAVTNYLPAADSDVYAEEQEFFNNQAIYEKIVGYSEQVPEILTGVYFYEARDALGTALTNVVNGADLDEEIEAAEETTEFYMN